MTAALILRDLRKTYPNGFQALKGIDLEVQEGDFFALLGPNGAGKSTTIGIICSLVRKTSGQVNVFGADLDTDLSTAKTYIGLVPQEFNFNQFEPAVEIVVNQGGYYGLKRAVAFQRAETYLKQLGLWEKRLEPARSLSGGMKRRLMIARALIHQPRLLILDEPTAGVDIEIRRSMWQFLREINTRGTTIILTTHYLEEAENLCRHIAIIDNGEITENTRMQTLLNRLHKETFVLDLAAPLAVLPAITGYTLRQVDETTLEADVPKELGMNGLFLNLSGQGIEVLSLRNKTNRLEELFMRMVDRGVAAAER
ncbi:MAG: ABC transporter ATP-binding protein [Gammaproteobacteria bacterium]|nr:ABC transporter ATP-binding protein [Gammaproteobacteria bacterium]